MKIKQIPEDFRVKEVANLSLGEGPFTYFLLRKKNWNTMEAVKAIAVALCIEQKMLSYAGIKDKHAVTQQYISALGVSRERIESVKIRDIELEYIGKGKEKMSSELLLGNEFIITLRGLEKAFEKSPKFIPNYFDEQRFGIEGKNHLVGKALVKREFGKACELLKLNPKDNDYVNALMEKRDLLVLCFNAYQSWLFNEALAEFIRRHYRDVIEVPYNAGRFVFAELDSVKNFELPLVHFDTEFENKEIKGIYEALLKREGIKQNDFLIKQLPNLVQQSPQRLAFVAVKDYKVLKVAEDELNAGKLKQVVSFFLPKGSYGTIVVKMMQAMAKVTI